MCKTKEPEFVQCYELHMNNGEILRIIEDYDLPYEDGVIGDLKRGEKQFVEFSDILGSYTVPFDQISFIVMTDVIKNE